MIFIRRSIQCAILIALLRVVTVAQMRPPATVAEDVVLVNEARGSAAGSRPAIAPFRSSVIVVWEDVRDAQALYQHAIYAQRFAFPNQIGANVALTPKDESIVEPDAACMADEAEMSIVFQKYSKGLLSSSIEGCRFDSACKPIGGRIRFSRDTTGTPLHPRVTVDRTKTSAVWQQYGSVMNVVLRYFDRTGIPLTDTIVVNGRGSTASLFPTVRSLSTGSIATAWINKGSNKRNIHAARVLASGAVYGRVQDLTQFVDDYQTGSPEIAALRDGGSVVFWSDVHHNGWNVWAQILDSSFVADDASQSISSEIPCQILADVSAATAESGNVIVVWEAFRGSNLTLAGQWLSPDGSKLGKNFYILSEGDYNSRRPTVRCAGSRAFIAWLDDRYTDDPAQFDVMMTAIGDPASTTIVDDTPDRGSPRPAIFPNPFSDRTRIDLSTLRDEATATVTIADVLGRVVFTRRIDTNRNPSLTFTRGDFPAPGFYFLFIRSKKTNSTHRLIVLER